MMVKKNTPYDIPDMSDMFAKMDVPGVDWDAVMDSQRKNLTALTEANKRLFDGAQAIMQQQVDILQKSMAELAEASKAMMNEDDPQAGTKQRFDLAKSSFETAIANMHELAEVAGKSNNEALAIISERASEAFEEIKAVIKSKK